MKTMQKIYVKHGEILGTGNYEFFTYMRGRWKFIWDKF